NINELKNLIIQGGFDGQVIKLKEVARVERRFKKTDSIMKVNGRQAVMLNVVKSSTSGIIKAVDAVKKKVGEYERSALKDKSIRLVILDDESESVRNRLSIIGLNSLIGFSLILLMLFLFLNFRSGIWVAMGIPFTFCFTLIISSFMGYTINNITLAAVIIVMGMIVDDAIVVSENISRLHDSGMTLKEASVKGTEAVFLPIVASIVTTCAAFLPLFAFSGRFAKMTMFIPPIIFLMLGGSLFESVFILPAHMNLEMPKLLKFFISKIKIDKSKTVLLSSEITDLADLGKEYGSIEEEEHELIHGLVEFKSVSVREVMTPRVDIDAIPEDATYEEVIRIITESGHSRIPLFEESLDIVLGIIYAKDLLPYIAKVRAKKNFTLKEICREAMFIPETKLISDLLHDFQEKNMHIGIVVDEYGGTAGLVSLEDILEEIVGEIRDEYDKEEAEIVKLGEGKYSVLGKLPIDELNEIFEDDFTSENDDYDTVGGFIFNHAGMIPENKYILDFKNYKFTVKDVANNRINKVIVEKLPLKEDDK
ncbi:MAG: efflux RND transporter permease subunit, partial [Melioribacteraceae bacterium]|nr:efflux RND transporter permease subunit [Melioribacteraceae bacterium]